ncbi:unnamed protein product [Peronospora destructor]|uniref:Uncharacterized protein n=1 Tax=Peronospora destructor TaxID=86335 RepID=A0AAV0TFE3_9STRA|nr:unnamed protein product [Peronospora destructor]
MVVCQFSPPGNDGVSAWYVHADSASKCPSGMSASLGLCVDNGDAVNEQIAPIPAGKLTYEVYPAYVADMQTVLIEAARGIANGEQLSTATMAVPTAMTATPASSSKTPLKTPSASSNKDVGGTETSATEKTPSSSKTPSANSNKDVGGAKTSAADETSTNTHSSMETSTENKSSTTELLPGEDLVPGTVKVSSDNGSTFSNEETSTKNQTSSSPTSTPNTGNDERITASTPIPGSSAVTGTNYKAPSGISVAGMTGIAVLAIVGVAAFGAIMSYKRNQRRQRKIMRDGGIQAN